MGLVDLGRMFDGVPRIIRDQSTPRAIDSPLVTFNPAKQQTYFTRTGQSYELSGQIYDYTKPFRITLSWTDPAVSPNTFKTLVNDLDMEVSVGGKLYKGNVFAGPNSVTGGNFDDINNTESVFLPAGTTGQWRMVVQIGRVHV